MLLEYLYEMFMGFARVVEHKNLLFWDYGVVMTVEK